MKIPLLALLGLLFLTSSAARGQGGYQWSIFAGSVDGPGYSDGTGIAARFTQPRGVAADASGNVYVADTDNFTIRKITSAGVVSTLAGEAGSSGSADGTGSAARFDEPFGVAVDVSGNVYVADSTNSTIRKITSAGVVSTLAGTAGSSGTADGTGSGARFSFPNAVAVDGSGNLYVTDGHTIRKVTSGGVVTTLAGSAGSSGSDDGAGSVAQFSSPSGVAVDGSGNVYVADTDNSTIRKITSSGVVSTLAGTAGSSGSANGAGSAARFDHPEGVAVDGSGNVYVADTGNHTIRKITSGVVSTLAGTAGSSGSADGTGSAARFDDPEGVAVGASGIVYVADSFNDAVRKITSAGSVSTLAGSVTSSGSANGTGSTARFFRPYGVAVDGTGNVYVADTSNFTIRKITSGGVVTTLAGTAGSSGSADGAGSAARFAHPSGVAVDGSGNVYVGDASNNTIRKITSGGVVTTLAGKTGSSGSTDGAGSAARFGEPRGVAVDGSGNVYVADNFNSTIRKITSAGVVSTLAGAPGIIGSADGIGSAARFNRPNGVAVDGSGNVYVADTSNYTIRKITSGGAVTTLAGTALSYGSADGVGSAARLDAPESVAVDGRGNVYVSDRNNHTMRKITSTGVVSTIGGQVQLPGNEGGLGSAARFNYPHGVAVHASGTLYVAGFFNHNIVVGRTTAALASDFNRDGKPDYILANPSNGNVYVFYLNGGAYAGGAPAATVPAGYQLKCAADMNGDGQSDFVLFNPSTRAVLILYLHGPTYAGYDFGPTPPPNWVLVSVADFNNDGKPDYLLRNTSTRQTAIWYLNGAAYAGAAAGPTIPSALTLLKAADFNGDGKPDYLFFNLANRQTSVWYLNGANGLTYAGTGYGPTPPPGWVLSGVADFNADGMNDFVILNTSTCQTYLWFLNGVSYSGAASGPTLPAGFNLASP